MFILFQGKRRGFPCRAVRNTTMNREQHSFNVLWIGSAWALDPVVLETDDAEGRW